MRFNEPFLINPVRSGRRRKRSRKNRIKRIVRRFKKTRRTRRARRNPLADLMIMNSPRRKHRRKRSRTLISRSTGRGEKQMAKRGRKRSRRTSGGKGHRLSLTSGYRVSKHTRIARKHRGMKMNPAILGMKLPAIMPLMNDVLGITAGYVAVKLVPKYLFPAIGITEPTGIMGTVTKVAVVIGVSVIAGVVLKKPAIQRALVLGGLVAIAVDLLGQTGVLADGMGGYILPEDKLSGWRNDGGLLNGGDDEYEDTRR